MLNSSPPEGLSSPKITNPINATSTHANAAAADTSAVEITLAPKTWLRLGMAVNVARIIPCRYSWPVENTPSRPMM